MSYAPCSALPPGINHIWIRLHAEEDEHVYGGGEQFSYFDLRGKTFPIWIREQVNIQLGEGCGGLGAVEGLGLEGR